MRAPHIACCAIAGIVPLIWLPALPAAPWIKGLIIAGGLLGLCRRPALRYGGLTALFFCWGVLAARQAIWPMQTLPGKNRQVEITLTASDGQGVYQGDIVSYAGRRLLPAPGIILYGGPLPGSPCAGQRWAMTIRARPVHGQLNEGGFDSQRYALAQHRPLTGRLLSARSLDARCSWRARYLASLNQTLSLLPWRQVMLALGLGERLAVPAEIRELMRQTGTSHLMAISGLHIALGATLGWLLLRGLQFWLPARLIGWRSPLVVGLFIAMLYAVLTGLQPPAQRTIVALAIAGYLRLTGRCWSPWQVWLCCIAAILAVDPLAALSQSLWLSVFAVAALLFWHQWLPPPRLHSRWPARALTELLHLQLGLMVLLLPLQVLIFHGFSLTSIAANLLAVPLVTLLVVPAILLAMALHLSGPLWAEMSLWRVADRLLAALFWFLRQLPNGWVGVDRRWQGVMLLPWLALVVWRLRVWRQLAAVCLTTVILLLLPFWRRPPSGWTLTMLDVGQGLALVIARGDKAILYDTGPAWPGGDSGRQLIIPWLRWHGLRPEGIILSHEHLDHRGGLASTRLAWPDAWLKSPLGWPGHGSCFRGDSWRWRGLTFRVLWPLPGAAATGNNRSCVVRLDDGRYSVLLTGDIEAPAELAMISHYWRSLPSTVIQVPHHGSNTSSGDLLLRRVAGEAALASASRYNAWHMPSPAVRRRYLRQGYRWFDTPHQGQITINFTGDGWQIHTIRDQIFRRWYHQWFGDTGDNG